MFGFRLLGSGVNHLLTESDYRRTGCNFDILQISYLKKNAILLVHLVVLNIKIKWIPFQEFYLLGYNAMRSVESPKRLLTFNRLHGVISQKIELFIPTSVRTSDPA
jgi:hypothetical protein